MHNLNLQDKVRNTEEKEQWTHQTTALLTCNDNVLANSCLFKHPAEQTESKLTTHCSCDAVHLNLNPVFTLLKLWFETNIWLFSCRCSIFFVISESVWIGSKQWVYQCLFVETAPFSLMWQGGLEPKVYVQLINQNHVLKAAYSCRVGVELQKKLSYDEAIFD